MSLKKMTAMDINLTSKYDGCCLACCGGICWTFPGFSSLVLWHFIKKTRQWGYRKTSRVVSEEYVPRLTIFIKISHGKWNLPTHLAAHTQLCDTVNTKELSNSWNSILDRKIHSGKGEIKNAQTTYSRTYAIDWAQMEKQELKKLC